MYVRVHGRHIIKQAKILTCGPSKSAVHNLRHMYPQEYICLCERVHLRLVKEGKTYLYIIHFQIFVHISVNVLLKINFFIALKMHKFC